jgi:predicted MFS family arabinose efflux permease
MSASEAAAAGVRKGDATLFGAAHVAYVLLLLWLTLLLRFIDLQIVAVLLEPLKAEFRLTDTQLGLLGGFAFAIFYGLLGLPVAWIADRYCRKNLIAIAVGVWSLMTALCAGAGSFGQLLLARIGVGVGEAGGTPPAFSLLSDYVPPARRATAFAIVNSSQPIGVFCGLLIGGWIAASYGWRMAFLAAGIPGVVLAVVIWTTLREPPRGRFEPRVPVVAGDVREVARYLFGLASYRHLVAANTLALVGAAGGGVWIPSYFMRVHGMSLPETASWLAIIYGCAGTLGVIIGGAIADRLVSAGKQRRVGWYAWVPALSLIAVLPFSGIVFLAPEKTLALSAHVFGVILMHAWLGPHHATIQSLAGPARRSMATAINLLIVNVVGLGSGPLIVGMLNDALAPTLGAEAIRYSLLGVVALSFTWAAAHFWLAGRTLNKDWPIGSPALSG